MKRLALFSLMLAALAVARMVAAEPAKATTQPASPKTKAPKVPGADIFDRPTLLDLKITLTKEALQSLREKPREYAPATVIESNRVYTNVAIKLKGAAGSFRHVDDQPALTLSFTKLADGQKFHGLRRIHLNNSVQDSSYLNEYLASALYREVGVPTPRVAWANLEFGGRKLGLYVLKEGFAREFLGLTFHRTDGNLYDGGFVRDVDQDLELDEGGGVKDHSDLHALTDAAYENVPSKRWQELQKVLDVDRFITYAALSVMLADWDGYPLNRNNYRVYFNPTDGKAVFMPHGMDQLFQRTDMDMYPGWQGLVARGLLETREGKRQYEARFKDLFRDVFVHRQMTNMLAQAVEVLTPAQPDIDWRARHLSRQIKARIESLADLPELQPPAAEKAPK
jgi:spore coat protein CotH